jgi:hypothetical protein
MRAFTRKPQPDHDSLNADALSELMVVDETDTLTPITATAPLRVVADESALVPSVAMVESPLSSDALNAYHSLMRFAASDVPVLGWQRVVFVVTGIVLGPSRAERELRVQVLLLLDGVGSLVIDATKEAAP